MSLTKSEKNNLIFSLGIIIIVFILSANLAWINPDTRGAIKVLKFPLFWQYDVDSILELGVATHFPEIFKDLPARLTRPLYPLIVHTFGNIFYFLSPIKFDFVYFIAFSYLLTKLFVYIASAFCLIKICSYFKLEEKITKIVLLILFFNSILIKSITTFHTTELQILLPIISVYFYILFWEKRINIVSFSLILGLLFLSKNNYAIIVAIFLHLIYNKKFTDSLSFIILFYFPSLLWTIFYQNFMHINWSIINQSKNYGWFDFNLLDINLYFKSFFIIVSTFFKSYFMLFLLIPIYIIKHRPKLIDKNYGIFIFLFFLSIMLQMFVTNKQSSIYMTKDINFIYCIILAIIIYEISNRFDFFSFNKITIFVFSLVLLINSTIKLGNFPLIHPYDQKILEDHKRYMKKGLKYEK